MVQIDSLGEFGDDNCVQGFRGFLHALLCLCRDTRWQYESGGEDSGNGVDLGAENHKSGFAVSCL